MWDLIFKYSGIIGVIWLLYEVYNAREQPTTENPNPNNLTLYLLGLLGAVICYFIVPITIVFAVECLVALVGGMIGAFVMFAPLLIGIAIFGWLFNLFRKK